MRAVLASLIVVSATFAVHCSSSEGAAGSGDNASSPDKSAGGCGASTPYCAAQGICIDPNCSAWCHAGANVVCDATESSALKSRCAGATIHQGCDSLGSSGGGGAGAGGGCAAGSTYCASCNVCLPSQSCGAYWCAVGSQAACSTTPNLQGCTGPVHNGCDCAGTGGGSSSGGGSGTACHDLTQCVGASTHATNDCTQGIGYDLTNNCGQAAYCRACAVQNGAVNDNECQAFTVNASNIGQSFCGAGVTGVKYECTWTSDSTDCVRNF